jgi:hypothetical protein
VVIPLGGLGLAFLLAFQPGERPTMVVLAGAMMGYPLAAWADKMRQREQGQKDDEDP